MAVALRPGDNNDQTLGRLGLNFDQPAPLPTDRPFFYCASGTWATAACSVRPALPAGHTGSRRSFKRLWRLNGG